MHDRRREKWKYIAQLRKKQIHNFFREEGNFIFKKKNLFLKKKNFQVFFI